MLIGILVGRLSRFYLRIDRAEEAAEAGADVDQHRDGHHGDEGDDEGIFDEGLAALFPAVMERWFHGE